VSANMTDRVKLKTGSTAVIGADNKTHSRWKRRNFPTESRVLGKSTSNEAENRLDVNTDALVVRVVGEKER